MILQVDFWQLVGLVVSLAGAWFGGAKLFFQQVDKRLDERFGTQERDRQAQYSQINAALAQYAEDSGHRLDRLEGEGRTQGERLSRLEADVARMPNHDDLSLLYDKLNSLTAGVSALGGKIDGIEASLRQVVGRLIDRGMNRE